MQEYVLVYAEPHEDKNKVLLILKDRPAHLKGRLNMPGGKIEPDETPLEAAKREFLEETGFSSDTWIFAGKIFCDGILHIYKTSIYFDSERQPPRIGETEIVKWYDWNRVIEDKRLMPNIRLTIPLMRAGIYNWNISDLVNSDNKTKHTVDITFDIPMFYE